MRGVTVTIRPFAGGLQVDGVPGGERFVRPLDARLLTHGSQFAEVLAITDSGAVVDGFAHPTPDGETLLVRAGANGWQSAPFAAVRALVSGLSCDAVACAEAEA